MNYLRQIAKVQNGKKALPKECFLIYKVTITMQIISQS